MMEMIQSLLGEDPLGRILNVESTKYLLRNLTPGQSDNPPQPTTAGPGRAPGVTEQPQAPQIYNTPAQPISAFQPSQIGQQDVAQGEPAGGGFSPIQQAMQSPGVAAAQGQTEPAAPSGGGITQQGVLNMVDQVTKFFTHPLVQGAIGSLGAQLTAPKYYSKGAKFGAGLLGGLQASGNAQQQQLAQQHQEQQAAAQGIMSPEQRFAYQQQLEAVAGNDPNLKRSMALTSKDSPTYARDVQGMYAYLGNNDLKEAALEQKYAYQAALLEQKQQLETMKMELMQNKTDNAAQLGAARIEAQLTRINAEIDKSRQQLELDREKLENGRSQKYAESVAKYAATSPDIVAETDPVARQQKLETYKRQMGPLYGLKINPETGKAWETKPAAAPAGASSGKRPSLDEIFGFPGGGVKG